MTSFKIRASTPLILLVSALFLISCADALVEENFGEPITGNPGTEVTSSYFNPLKVGNKWVIEFNNDGIISESIAEITSSGTVGGFTVFYVNGSTTDYSRFTNKVGYTYASQTTVGGQTIEQELPMLDENKGIGETWEFTINTGPVGFETVNRYVNTVVAIEPSRDVLGNTYSDILHTLTETFTSAPSVPEFKSITTNRYWAKDIGSIESISETDFGGITNIITTRLISYTIN